jgi:hypothetical protein
VGNTNKCIFVGIDHYTKWIVAKVLNNKSDRKVSKCIENLIINEHGIPKLLLTDM